MVDDSYTLRTDVEDDASEQLDDVEDSVEDLDDQMEKGADTADEYSAALAGGIAGGLMDTAVEQVGELGGALVQQTQRFVENTAAIQRNAKAAGVSSVEYQKLQFAFQRVGLESQNLQEALNTISERAFDARNGAQGMIDDFRSLGITVDELRGKTPAELFRLTTEAIGDAESKTRAAKGATSLLGDELATALLPRLRENADAFKDLGQEAFATGNVMGTDTIEKARQAEQSFNRLAATLRGIRKEGFANLLPFLQKLNTQLLAIAQIQRAEGTGAAVSSALKRGVVASISQAAPSILAGPGAPALAALRQAGIGGGLAESIRGGTRSLLEGGLSAVGAGIRRGEELPDVKKGGDGPLGAADDLIGALESLNSAMSDTARSADRAADETRDAMSAEDRLRESLERSQVLREEIAKQENRQFRREMERLKRQQVQVSEIETRDVAMSDLGGAGLALGIQRRARKGRRLVGLSRGQVAGRRAGQATAAVGRGAAAGFRGAGRGASRLVQMQERGARAAAIHNRAVSEQVRLYSELGSQLGGLGSQLGELAKMQFRFGKATEKTKAAVSGLSKVGGVASQFIEGTRKRAGVKALFETAASAAAFAGYAASGGTAANLLAAGIQHGVAAATFGAVASGAVGGGGGAPSPSGGGAAEGGGTSAPGGGSFNRGFNPEQQRQKTAEAFASALESKQRQRPVEVKLGFSGDDSESARLLTSLLDDADQQIQKGIGRGGDD